ITGTFVVTMSVFWVANFWLILIDVTGKPASIIKYRVQDDNDKPVDKDKLKRALKQVVFNQVIIGLPFIYVMYKVMKYRGCDFTGELPSFQWVLLEIAVYALVEELGFYYSHRLLHHPRVYKYIHKQHHEWTAPIGIISLYAHPVEHLVSNLIPPALGPILMGSHLATAWLWFALALLSTTVSHSGYHFPLLPSPEAHDYHHLKFTNNFGVLGVLDRLHGTDAQFRASKMYDRHILLLSLTPVTEQFPKVPATKEGKKD
ncbi:hypothetical protein FSP39_007604, partial [Pinctada imbricata]